MVIWHFGTFVDFVFNFQQRLSFVFDVDAVLFAVVVFEGGTVVADSDIMHIFVEDDVKNTIESAFPVAGHDDSIVEHFSDLVSPVFFVLVLMLLVDGVDNVEDEVISDYLSGGVHSQENSSF